MSKVINKEKHKGKVLDKKDGVKVIDCTICGFKHVHPLPSDAELRALYEKEYYQNEKPNYFKETKEDIAWWMATYNNLYSILEKNSKGRKILDVGSGPGHFLAAGKKRGWNVLGIEPSPAASKYSTSRGLSVMNDFFSHDLMREHGPFDVIHISLVLEHVPNPISFINDIKKLLKPGGLISIILPNDYNPFQRIIRDDLKFKPWWVMPRHHLNYFSLKSMEKLLTARGLKTVDSLGNFPMEFFLLSGNNYVGNPTLGRKCHHERVKFEMNMYKKNAALLTDLYRNLGKQGLGREFIIIARKKS